MTIFLEGQCHEIFDPFLFKKLYMSWTTRTWCLCSHWRHGPDKDYVDTRDKFRIFLIDFTGIIKCKQVLECLHVSNCNSFKMLKIKVKFCPRREGVRQGFWDEFIDKCSSIDTSFISPPYNFSLVGICDSQNLKTRILAMRIMKTTMMTSLIMMISSISTMKLTTIKIMMTLLMKMMLKKATVMPTIYCSMKLLLYSTVEWLLWFLWFW